MLRAVCFDFDGTLARFRGDFDDLLDALRTDLGLLACDFTTFRARLSNELRREGPLTLNVALAATLERLDQRLPPDLPAVVESAVEQYAKGVELLPGADELLAELEVREFPLALITNGPSDMQRAAVRALGLEGCFEVILVSGDEDVGVRKPGRLIFELACSRLGVSAQESVMVGDDLDKDVEGARAVGMTAFHVAGGLLEAREWLVATLLRPAS